MGIEASKDGKKILVRLGHNSYVEVDAKVARDALDRSNLRKFQDAQTIPSRQTLSEQATVPKENG